MQAHRNGICALAFVMAVVALAVPVYGNGEQKPKPELKVDARSGEKFTSFVRSTIATGDGVRLRLTKFAKQYEGADYSYIKTCPFESSIPDGVSENSNTSFCYGSFHTSMDFKDYDTGFYFYYDILVPDGGGEWRPSGYWVDGATKVPMIGERKIDCTIKRSGSTNRADGAPFSCETSWTGEGNVSEPHWKITAKGVTEIDASQSAKVEQAAQLIGANCEVRDTPRCVWTRTQKSSAFLADRNDWVSLTNWADSCPPATKEFVLNSNRSVSVSWSDKVGGKISGKIIGDVLVFKVEGTLEVNYEHSITQTDSYGEGYTYNIPLGYRSALYLQHGMLEVSGDFSIITDNDRFLVKNAVFRFPLQKDVQVEGRGQPVPRGVVVHVDLNCTEKAPPLGAPPPAEAKSGGVTAKR